MKRGTLRDLIYVMYIIERNIFQSWNKLRMELEERMNVCVCVRFFFGFSINIHYKHVTRSELLCFRIR